MKIMFLCMKFFINFSFTYEKVNKTDTLQPSGCSSPIKNKTTTKLVSDDYAVKKMLELEI